ncbi:ABC transporter ATP-binding protein [Aquisalinus luteolus]|uniref:ABC transporter n=1 Tax=Aquisalinus luteolus TaxID=1566827 RepID=A0A8J3A2Q4_9PROT|nr:ABC transporter ATP-binding protein [Aquisalinus luteolus]GGH94494.1 ABC transporter [Aquisalinus luteolus]
MLEFRNISHAYGDRLAVENVSLKARAGEVTCLFGPSGCGKTTLLRLAGGLMPVQAGEILLDDELIGGKGRDIAPEKRAVGLVFQEGALFPHLTVAKNVAFGLSGPDKQAKAAELLALVGLAGFEKRYPHTLSGGQQQRVALARALAPEPRVLLFDEPYASLDTQLRRDLREQARRMIRRTGTIGIVVSHDPEEVLEMADSIVVLEEGRLRQSGSPAQIHDQPATEKIAAMFGNGQLLPADYSDGAFRHVFGDWSATCLSGPEPVPGPVSLVVRPDALELVKDANGYPVVDVRLAGVTMTVHVEAPGGEGLRVSVARSAGIEPGERVRPMPVPAGIFAFARSEA